MAIVYANTFTALDDFTTVNSEGGNGSVSIVSSEARIQKTAGASSAFNTLGFYSTNTIASLASTYAFFFDFSLSNISTRDAFILFKDSTGIDYNAGTNRGGVYLEGGGGATNAKMWDTNTTAGAGISVSASTDYRVKVVVNANGTLTGSMKLTSEPDGSYATIGTTTLARTPTYVGVATRFAPQLYTNNTDLFIDNLYLTNDGTFNPPDPSNLAVVAAGQTQIDLTWDDNGTAISENGTSIERSLTSGSGFSEIDTVAQGTTSYSDTTALPGTTYYYRVRTYVSAYGDTYYSGYSSEASATTESSGDDGEDMLALGDLE